MVHCHVGAAAEYSTRAGAVSNGEEALAFGDRIWTQVVAGRVEPGKIGDFVYTLHLTGR